MKEKNVIEVCVGVGMNQIFPETIKVVIEENIKLPNVKEEDRDHDKYFYFEL
jgi:hypothetical protein